MSDIDPAKAQWQWDEVPHYRLNDEIIHKYLSELWEGYNFVIEVNATSPSVMNFYQTMCSSEARNSNSGFHENSKRYLSHGHGQMARMPCQQR